MKINFKVYKFLLASVLFCYSANGQNLQKKYTEAYKYYEKKEYSKAEEICSQILLAGPKSVKDLNDIWFNHTAAYLMYFMYHDSTNANFNLKISKDYLDLSKEYIDLLLSKDSKLREKIQPRIRMIDSIAATFNPIKEASITTVDSRNNIKASTQETPTSATSSSNVGLMIAEEQVNEPPGSKNNVQSEVKENSDKKNVTIIVNSSGKTLEEAKLNAFRDAIEETVGLFLETRTEIGIDSLLLEEITSISSANILNYEIINQNQKEDGSISAIFKINLSAAELKRFVKSRGGDMVFDGESMLNDLKYFDYKELEEKRIISFAFDIIHEKLQISFDYKVEAGTPYSMSDDNKKWKIPLKVIASVNKTFISVSELLIKTLESLNLSNEELAKYKLYEKNIFQVKLISNNRSYNFNFRTPEILFAISNIMNRYRFYCSLFVVESEFTSISGTLLSSTNGRYFLPNGNLILSGIQPSNIQEICRANELWDPRKQIQSLLNLKYLSINFPNMGSNIAEYQWDPIVDIETLEKIKGFNVKAKGVVSKHAFGGFFIPNIGEKGLVLFIPPPLVDATLDDANSYTDIFQFNGYNDWRIPTIDELRKIKNILVAKDLHHLLFRNHSRYFDQTGWESPRLWSSDVDMKSKYGGKYLTYKYDLIDGEFISNGFADSDREFFIYVRDY